MPADANKPRPQILVVEDNLSALNLLARFLERLGCEVSAEPNGSLALRRARKDPPDLIFMDMRLPGLDGLEVLPRLRRMRGLKDVPVVCMSGFSYPEMKREALASGCCAFLEKPFDLDEVHRIVREALGFDPADEASP